MHLLRFVELFPKSSPREVLSRIFPLSLFGYDRSISGVVAKSIETLQSKIFKIGKNENISLIEIIPIY